MLAVRPLTVRKHVGAGLMLLQGPEHVRVNAISAGPVNTVAARGIRGFVNLRDKAADAAPLGEYINGEDVGGMATFLASDASKMVTGQVMFGTL